MYYFRGLCIDWWNCWGGFFFLLCNILSKTFINCFKCYKDILLCWIFFLLFQWVKIIDDPKRCLIKSVHLPKCIMKCIMCEFICSCFFYCSSGMPVLIAVIVHDSCWGCQRVSFEKKMNIFIVWYKSSILLCLKPLINTLVTKDAIVHFLLKTEYQSQLW